MGLDMGPTPLASSSLGFWRRFSDRRSTNFPCRLGTVGMSLRAFAPLARSRARSTACQQKPAAPLDAGILLTRASLRRFCRRVFVGGRGLPLPATPGGRSKIQDEGKMTEETRGWGTVGSEDEGIKINMEEGTEAIR